VVKTRHFSSRYYRLNPDGSVTPVRDLTEAFNDDKRIIKQEDVGKYHVSTVFLVIDHSFDGGRPVLWETMIFGDGPLNDWTQRYSSHGAALAGHNIAIQMVRESLEE
jgi:hypothetical protein